MPELYSFHSPGDELQTFDRRPNKTAAFGGNMKNLILALLALVISASPLAQAEELKTFEGKITSVVTGEFDPSVVGDACVVSIQTATGVVAFVTDFDLCEDYRQELTVGRGLTVVSEAKEQVVNQEQLEILRKRVVADDFYAVDFGSIENGLAD